MATICIIFSGSGGLVLTQRASPSTALRRLPGSLDLSLRESKAIHENPAYSREDVRQRIDSAAHPEEMAIRDCERPCAGIDCRLQPFEDMSGLVMRARRASRHRGVVAFVSALVLLVAPGVATASLGRSAQRRAAVCQRRPGHTMMRRGEVRVFRASGVVYGCVKGSLSAWPLWRASRRQSGSVAQVNRQFVAVDSRASDQYAFDASLRVFDLRSGRSYSIASESEPLSGGATGDPSTPGPWPVEKFVLGPDGRAVRLYERFTAAANDYSGTVIGQVLDVIGFHKSARRLATSPPGGIAPGSLTYDGHMVTWTQDGTRRAASI